MTVGLPRLAPLNARRVIIDRLRQRGALLVTYVAAGKEGGKR